MHSRLLVINRDVPGMIAFISTVFGSHQLNIAGYLNSSNGTVGYNIIDVESEISPVIVHEVQQNPDVIRTRLICFK